ncbi:Gfo/Idh/MocA family oxidoreductase [Stenotrophomonas maltophilia]|jgi:predicted dehydrogenase|uniref:Gfo/Idh/MocA family protein n=1 Tax=Stenotrophomonas TaxID=40323 RepID=UPI000DA74525|nr:MULTISPECIES: Gfo/Idh/MocA family oxidoreductase [Stenotrophomonas]MBA0220578.1 gfo/Idh/MocA family oxidoreductase [Stenotrophomonas maltophilia]MCO7398884.1 Gfo/Idh/MocA family oxidoreductase [Stenotrophomonas maltophilia]MCO7412565.1 Gfo/Idh/MocA family oxidoreductase [Stenotrophomonas maltophilia]MCU1023223.1 Gfo/Idh/MocA family oxidoreductase [Stenotrophomonas maltophilia]MDH0171816.1 Gfo/Idh/MocA family oxidoreductase [Stenotrophomonas sp. GD04145]
MSKLGIAIVGTGMIGAVHRRAALLAGAEVRGVAASSPQRAQEVAQAWNVAHAYRDIEEVVSDPQVQVVHVCTPNHLHRAMAQAALEAGKHVICEKPLATTLDDAQALAALAARTGLVATVPFVYRYHPVVREARARIAQGELGPLHLIHGSYLQDWLLDPASNNWRVDPSLGGTSRVFADIGSHWCDLVEWVSGERFAEVSAAFATVIAERGAVTGQSFTTPAAGGTTQAVSSEDVATAMLRTSAGTLASLTVSQVSAGRHNRLWFEIDGARASVAFNQEDAERLWIGRPDQREDSFVRGPGAGSAEQRRLSVLPAGHAQGYGNCFEAFVADTYRAIAGEQPEGLPTFDDGLRSARIVTRVIASARSRAWTAID